MTNNPNDKPAHPSGLLSHRVEDIARILESLHARERPITTLLGADEPLLRSRLLFVDPQRHYIVIASPGESEAQALLARSNVNFFAEHNGWHIEFTAADPQPTSLGGKTAIRLRFPGTIVSQQQRRMEPRIPVSGDVPLHCEADSAGFAPFDGQLVDISNGGIGFLLYDAGVSLEPGTVLKECRIQRPGKPPIVVDLEVRYSRPVILPDGRHANRSGCVFLNPTREISGFIDTFSGESSVD